MARAKQWMLGLVAALAASAALAETETVAGVTWGYTMENGTATVTNAAPVGTSLEIPPTLGGCPVATIGDHAFAGCGELMSVSIPASVTRLGGLAFSDCGSLREIVIPDGVEHIGWGTFFNCGALDKITVGRGLKDVDKYSFFGCDALREVHVGDLAAWCGIEFAETDSNPLCRARRLFVDGREIAGNLTIPGNVEKIALGAFYGCGGLTSVTFPDNVKAIGDYAFEACSALTNAVLGNGVANVGACAFRQCAALSSVTLGNAVTNLEDAVFFRCPSLANVPLPAGLKSIGGSVFTGCSALTEMALPDGLESIGGNVFADCTGLSSLVIPAGVREIKEYAFKNCSSLTNVVFPNGVKGLGKEVFSGCAALRELALPSNLTRIGSGAFSGCDALETLRISDLKAWCGISFADAEANPIRRVRVFAGDREITGHIVIPEGTQWIGERAFLDCGTLASVSLPASLWLIRTDAFAGCRALESFEVAEDNTNFSSADGVLYDKGKTRIILCPQAKTGPCAIPESVSDIADRTFQSCAGLSAVSIPGSVTNIGAHAFEGCTGLSEVVLPAGLAGLGEFAFADCSGLETLEVPGSLEIIGNRAFDSCSSLTSAVLRAGVGSIGSYAFAFCGALKEISIPSTVTNIGYAAFLDCRSLGSLVLPDGVESIGKYAFQGCSALESMVVPAGVKNIATGTFCGCGSLRSVVLPDGVADIGNDAFNSCHSLKTMVLPPGVRTIGTTAFEGCTGLTMLSLPESVTRIGMDAFRNCPSLARVYVPPSWKGSDLPGKGSRLPSTQSLVYGDPPENWETASPPGPVAFSPDAGMWPDAGNSLEVALSEASGAAIYYTLDGSRPVWLDADGAVHWSATAKECTGPLLLQNGRDAGTSAISRIMTGNNESDTYDPWYAPAEPPRVIPVLRAAAVGPDGQIGGISSASYLLGDMATRYGGTPVVSLCAEWADLFDNTNGPGIYRYPTVANKTKVANAHVEFFDAGARQFAKWCELRPQGGTTLGRPKKSLRLTGWKGYAAGKGKKEPFDYPFFADESHRTHSAVVLRMGGNDWNRAILRDRLAQELGADDSVDGEAGAVCVLFLDGVYWGVHELRERHDSAWFKNRLGIGDSDAFSLLEYGDNDPFPKVAEGLGEDDPAQSTEAYADFWSILRQLEAWNDDLSDPARWSWFTNRVNPDSLAAHFAASLFTGNSDWPWNNQQWWRAWPDGPAGGKVDRSRPRNDGRWNWTFHDMDFAFALPFDYVPDWNDGLFAAHDSYSGVFPGEGPYVGAWLPDAARPFHAAMSNPDFRNRFLARVFLRLATDWSPAAATAALERVADQIRAAGMDENGARWRQPQTAADWERQIAFVRGYLRARPEAFSWHTRRRYGLGAPRTVVLGTDGDGAGSVRVAGRAVDAAALPLRGGFPRDLPLELEAVPAPGSIFAGWFSAPSLLPEPSPPVAEDRAANYGGSGGDFPSASLGTGWGPWTPEGGTAFTGTSSMPIHGRSENGHSFGLGAASGETAAIRRCLASGAVLGIGEEMSLDVAFGLAGGNGGAGVTFVTENGDSEPIRLVLASDGPDGESFRLTLDGLEFVIENLPHLPGAPIRLSLARTAETAYALRIERGGETFGTDVSLSREIAGVRLWKNPYGTASSPYDLWFDNLRVAPAAAETEPEALSSAPRRPAAFHETGADLSRWTRKLSGAASVWTDTKPLCNIGLPSFGMSAGEGSRASLRRKFGFALTNGYELSFAFQNNAFVGSASAAGAVFLTERGESFVFFASGSGSTYRLRVSGGEEIDTGIPLLQTGLTVSVSPLGDNQVSVSLGGRDFVLDAPSDIDGIEFFDRACGTATSQQVFFNRVAVRCDPGVPLPPHPREPDFLETGADRANWTFSKNIGSAGGWAGGDAEDSPVLGPSSFFLYAGGPDPLDAAPYAEAVRVFPDAIDLGTNATLSFRFAHGDIGSESEDGIGAVGWTLLDADARPLAVFSAVRDAGEYLWNGAPLDAPLARDTPHDVELRFSSPTSFDLFLDAALVAGNVSIDAPVRGLRFWNAKAGSGQARNLLFNDVAVYLPAAAEPAARRRPLPRDAAETLLSTDKTWTLLPSNDTAVVARFLPRPDGIDAWAAELGIDDPWALDPETGRSFAEKYLLETNAVETLHAIDGKAYQLRFSPGEHGVGADIEVTDSLSDASSWRSPLPGELPPLDSTGRRFAFPSNSPRLFLRLLLRPAD